MNKFKISQQKDIKHAIANRIYFNKNDHNMILAQIGHKNKDKAYIKIQDFVYLTDVASYVEQGSICLSKMQRENLMLSTTMDFAVVSPFRVPHVDFQLSVLKVELKPFRLEYPKEIKESELNSHFRKLYQNHFFGKGQSVYFDFKGVQMVCRILAANLKVTGMKKEKRNVGMFTEDTDLEFTCNDITKLKIKSDSKRVS